MNRTVQEERAGAEAGEAARGRRLIEEWLPIAEIGIEALRERTPMTPFPAPNRLHVWWARRPLVASRAAILASLLPADADREKFMHILGIHGDPVAAKVRIAEATKRGERLGKDAYGYPRAFGYVPTAAELEWIRATAQLDGDGPTILDSTAGGGSIPFEAIRLGCRAIANDLNPVAWLILKTTVEFPAKLGPRLLARYNQLGKQFAERCRERLAPYYAPEPQPEGDEAVTLHGERIPDGYLWARTVRCPYCNGLVPLSPNWRLNNKGVGVRLVPRIDDPDNRRCEFEIVHKLKDQSQGTVKGGDGLCPFPDCGRVIDGDEHIKPQAKAGQMGDQLYAVVYTERRVVGHTAKGKPKLKKVRGFRAPRPEDDVSAAVQAALDEKLPEWEARNIIPSEAYPANTNDDRPRQYGMPLWREMFSPRQLLGHGTSVEVFHELVDECGGPGRVNSLDTAALSYIALALDKMADYNSRLSRFEITKQRMANTFSRHDFAFCWSFAEMAPTIAGLGYDWVTTAVGKALYELIELAGHKVEDDTPLLSSGQVSPSRREIEVRHGSGDDLPFVDSASVDAVVLDPPYYDNVMYAELADFFYVWLKRTAGLLFPEPFTDLLTDKDREAVANPAKFKDFSSVRGSGGAKKRAGRDYQGRMQAIFAEARRVLKPDGIMTLMFTHKASGAWDALAKGLVEAGFVITASWPLQTEAEGSLHIKDKNAAKSTIFLVCRPRATPAADAEATYWEDVEPRVEQVVKQRVQEFQDAGIGGVDLYLACFGPALEVFSRNWPMTRGRPAPRPMTAKGAQFKLLEDEEFDPYAVRPEDALMAARSAVKQWRLSQIATLERRGHLDTVTEWFVLAWDAFKSPQFPADEALKLARVVGVNFDEKLRNHILEVKSGDVILWDSGVRAKKGAIGSFKSGVVLDALHLAAQAGREKNTGIAKELIENAELVGDGDFLLALQAVLEVLPVPKALAGSATGPIAGAAADAEALEQLRRLAFAQDVPTPKQWLLFEARPESGG